MSHIRNESSDSVPGLHRSQRRCCTGANVRVSIDRCRGTPPRGGTPRGGMSAMASVSVVAPRAASFPRGVCRRARRAAPMSTRERHRHLALALVPSHHRSVPTRTERRPRDARVSASKMETAVRGLDDAVRTSPPDTYPRVRDATPFPPTPPRPVQADRGASPADIQLTHHPSRPARVSFPSSPPSLLRCPSPCPDPRRNSPWAR
jgi:hypothetical protein